MFTNTLTLHPPLAHRLPNQRLLAATYEYPPSPRSLVCHDQSVLQRSLPISSAFHTAPTDLSGMAVDISPPEPTMSSPVSASGNNVQSNPNASQSQQPQPSRPHRIPSPSFSPRAAKIVGMRRQSRFDPMGEDEDDSGYEDLGQRHPLRRVAEEDSKQDSVSLPGIKSLFNVAQDHPPTPSSSSGSLFQSPSLPSLVSGSPMTSPSTARTSRYSSLASGSSFSTDSYGWWAPDFERERERERDPGNRVPIVSENANASGLRSRSFPAIYLDDEHDAKRRRSDGPLVTREHEEAARIRWQAQTRTPSAPSGTHLYHQSVGRTIAPQPRSSASRMSISTSAPMPDDDPNTEISPDIGSANSVTPTDKRPVAARTLSIVSGPLARSFADLTASEREHRQSISHDMPPPSLERKNSLFSVLNNMDRHLPSPVGSTLRTVTSQSSLRGSGTDAASLDRHLSDHSSTASPTPEYATIKSGSSTNHHPSYPISQSDALRRASLSELIKAKSGDNLANLARRGSGQGPSSGFGHRSSLDDSLLLEKPSLSEPLVQGWPERRESSDSVTSQGGLTPYSDSEAGGPDSSRRTRRRKRLTSRPEEVDRTASLDTGTGASNSISRRNSRGEFGISSGSTSTTSTPQSKFNVLTQPGGNFTASSHRAMDVLAEGAERMAEADKARRVSVSSSRPARDDMEVEEDQDDAENDNEAEAGDDVGRDGEPPMTVIQGPGGPKYECGYCAKTFSRPSSLRIHTYSHTGERPFICTEPSCGRRFSVQSNLKRHAKVHQMGQAGGASLSQLSAAATLPGMGSFMLQSQPLVHPQPYATVSPRGQVGSTPHSRESSRTHPPSTANPFGPGHEGFGKYPYPSPGPPSLGYPHQYQSSHYPNHPQSHGQHYIQNQSSSGYPQPSPRLQGYREAGYSTPMTSRVDDYRSGGTSRAVAGRDRQVQNQNQKQSSAKTESLQSRPRDEVDELDED